MNFLLEDQFWVKVLQITDRGISTKLCEEEYINKYGEFLLLSENHVVFATIINNHSFFFHSFFQAKSRKLEKSSSFNNVE